MINLRDPNEDLFSESRMSFGSHLEELRKVLVRSLIWVAIGCVVGFWGAEKIVEVLQLPLNKAVVKFKKSMAEEQLEKDLGYVPPEFLPLLKEGLVPDQVSVDPGQLVVALQTVIPNFGEAVNLEPYRFRTGHFKPQQIKNLCSRLSQLEASDPTQAARLEAVWKQLSTDQQSVIKQVASKHCTKTNRFVVCLSYRLGPFQQCCHRLSRFRWLESKRLLRIQKHSPKTQAVCDVK